MEQTKYDVFISYSRRDYVDELNNVISGNVVSKIKEALTYAGITYWFDEEGIYSGQNFVEKIVTNIENARIFLFLSSADEFKKHIIPVRIDSSPYNKKVMFRIADLDYIDYYTNPQKGMEDVVKSIKAYLEEVATEERRKAEEVTKQKEESRRKEEQLIADIKQTCMTLNSEEAKMEIERESLLKRVEVIENEGQKEELKNLINKSGSDYLKQKKYETLIESLTARCNELESRQSVNNQTIYEPTSEDLKRWNWGAFFLSWIWCIRNKINKWLTAMCFIIWLFPIVNLILSFILGYMGTKLAWENGKWKNGKRKDWEHFQTVQKEWNLFGFIYLFGYIIIMAIWLLAS